MTAGKQSEATIQRKIQLASTEVGSRLMRNNVGLFYTKNGTPIRCGLARGSSDLIGWTPRLIHPEHVGQVMAVFTAVEVKTPSGRLSDAQKQFIYAVNLAGGIAGRANSAEDFMRIIRGLK